MCQLVVAFFRHSNHPVSWLTATTVSSSNTEIVSYRHVFMNRTANPALNSRYLDDVRIIGRTRNINIHRCNWTLRIAYTDVIMPRVSSCNRARWLLARLVSLRLPSNRCKRAYTRELRPSFLPFVVDGTGTSLEETSNGMVNRVGNLEEVSIVETYTEVRP